MWHEMTELPTLENIPCIVINNNNTAVICLSQGIEHLIGIKWSYWKDVQQSLLFTDPFYGTLPVFIHQQKILGPWELSEVLL